MIEYVALSLPYFKTVFKVFVHTPKILKYRNSVEKSTLLKKSKKKGMISHPLSGWQDSNLRPPAPKAGAMTGLRYTPKSVRKYNI